MSTSLRQQLASYWQRIQFLETEIERLTRELAEAREALRPFALAASRRGEHEPEYSLRQPVKLGDLRRARAMLARLDAEKPK